jgi:hypothetical protein
MRHDYKRWRQPFIESVTAIVIPRNICWLAVAGSRASLNSFGSPLRRIGSFMSITSILLVARGGRNSGLQCLWRGESITRWMIGGDGILEQIPIVE